MTTKPLVSVIIIFLNAEGFIQDAIESVISQTYPQWELLLVNDGSFDKSVDIARSYADLQSGKIRYFEHPSQSNLGKVESRNLGIDHARGQYIAFLDSDDVLFPYKLAEQVEILEAHRDVSMLYGKTEYWFSWAGNSDIGNRDFSPRLGVPTGVLIKPPELLPLYLLGKAAIPCPSDTIFRTETVKKIGGFDNRFVGIFNIYEDQSFFTKVCLEFNIMAINSNWFRYRQHPKSSMAFAQKEGQEILARKFFLNWVQEYLVEKKVTNLDVWQALKRDIWRIQNPVWLPQNEFVHKRVRWTKKWLLRIEKRILPPSIRHRLWIPKEVINKHATENNLCKTRINQK